MAKDKKKALKSQSAESPKLKNKDYLEQLRGLHLKVHQAQPGPFPACAPATARWVAPGNRGVVLERLPGRGAASRRARHARAQLQLRL